MLGVFGQLVFSLLEIDPFAGFLYTAGVVLMNSVRKLTTNLMKSIAMGTAHGQIPTE